METDHYYELGAEFWKHTCLSCHDNGCHENASLAPNIIMGGVHKFVVCSAGYEKQQISVFKKNFSIYLLLGRHLQNITNQFRLEVAAALSGTLNMTMGFLIANLYPVRHFIE